MRTIYAVWHQAEGVVTSHLFEEPPTEAQMHALHVELKRRHNRAGMEVRVREVQLLEPGEVPQFEERGGGADHAAGHAAVAVFAVNGTGEIT